MEGFTSMRSGTEGKRDWELIVVTGIAVFAGICVTGIAATISYSHMLDWARVNGETGVREWRAKLFPLSVDGAIVVASTIIYVDARAKRGRDRMAYVVGAVGILWSIGANVGHTWDHAVAKMLISAWPPIALAVCVELLLRLIKRTREQSEQIIRKIEKAAPKIKAAPLAELVIPQPKASADPVVSITEEWVPADYANAKEAMYGYLLKVNADVTGAELDRIMAPHFEFTPGYGRKVVRDHKAQVAAASGDRN